MEIILAVEWVEHATKFRRINEAVKPKKWEDVSEKKIEVHMWLIILISQKATKNIIEGHFPPFDSK
jgi:hypothetical protein